jgi:hypothetical protein
MYMDIMNSRHNEAALEIVRHHRGGLGGSGDEACFANGGEFSIGIHDKSLGPWLGLIDSMNLAVYVSN